MTTITFVIWQYVNSQPRMHGASGLHPRSSPAQANVVSSVCEARKLLNKSVHDPKQNQPNKRGRKTEASETEERAPELRITWSMHLE
ncbi:hypothetical protein Q3G72_007050 [Acer saccharum]|nr:hypothetical protein Q3G72_007050 [Acer saccharum]